MNRYVFPICLSCTVVVSLLLIFTGILHHPAAHAVPPPPPEVRIEVDRMSDAMDRCDTVLGEDVPDKMVALGRLGGRAYLARALERANTRCAGDCEHIAACYSAALR